MATLAIDQGTSGTKVLLLEDSCRVIARGFSPLKIIYDNLGGVECDPELLWDSIIFAIDQVLKDYDGDISSIALANQGESILAWDKDSHRPLSPVIVWQDSRSTDLCINRSRFRSKIHESTGLEIDSYFVAPKMRWLRDHLDSNCVITTTDTWIISKLTGQYVTDVATASRSLLMDLVNQTWNPELIEIWGLESESLPKIVNNDVIVGEITNNEISRIRGKLLAGVILDQPASLLAQGCITSGEAKCTYGTGAFLLANTGENPVLSKNGLSTSVAWKINSGINFNIDGQVFTAASAIDWLVKNGFLGSPAHIDQLPIETNGVVGISGFAGYGAPRWKSRGTASITGLTLGTTKPEIARAVINGIAAQIAELINSANDDGMKIFKLRVDGGLTKSKTLMQMQADLSQIPVEVFPHPDATAIGAAVLSKLALNPKMNVKQAIPDMKLTTIYTPRWGKERALEFMHNWTLMANQVKERNDV